MIKALLIVGTGGFLGSALRFLFYQYIDKYLNVVFPLATFVVNIIGSFALGLVIGLSFRENSIGPEWRLFLATGFCGGFTTFSSLSMDAFGLIQQGRIIAFLLYAVASIILGISATALGIILTKYNFL